MATFRITGFVRKKGTDGNFCQAVTYLHTTQRELRASPTKLVSQWMEEAGLEIDPSNTAITVMLVRSSDESE